VYSQKHQAISGIEVDTVALPKAPFPLFASAKKLLKALYRIYKGRCLRKKLRAFKPQIVHAHFLTDSGCISSWIGYHTLVLTAHGSDILIHPERSRIDKTIARFSLHTADVVTIVARHMKPKVQQLGCAPHKIVYLPNFVDTQQFNICYRRHRDYQKGLTKPVVVSARSLKRIYNVNMLIEAIPGVIQEISDARFIIIGEGSERKILMDRARQLHIDYCVEFLELLQ
jgi:glycosyltransferase involved in cell wall biosynthesis